MNDASLANGGSLLCRNGACFIDGAELANNMQYQQITKCPRAYIMLYIYILYIYIYIYVCRERESFHMLS